MTGLEEVEHHWKEDKEAALNPCKKLKHVLQRTARDSPDVRFVTLEVGPPRLELAACSFDDGTYQPVATKQALLAHERLLLAVMLAAHLGH